MHITVYGASRPAPGDEEYETGVQLGRALAAAGHTVITGGYGGVMEAVSKGARTAGGHTIGVTTPSAFPQRTGANAWVVEEISTPDLATRIRTLLELADAAIALPGSLGTFTEIALTWNMNYVTKLSGGHPTPLLAVGPMWARLVPELAALLETEPSALEWADEPLAAIEWLATLP
jgi:uncharacterized protein (TIGR00730 family)